MTDDGKVKVTLRDVWEAQHEQAKQLTAISTQLATLTTRVESRLDSAQTSAADHEARLRQLEKTTPDTGDQEGRIRALERFRYTLVGGVVVLQAATALVQYLLTRK